MKNKKADISITILVIAVVVLCTVALFSFYLVWDKMFRGGINHFTFLQEVYNTAESVKYSENIQEGLYDKYNSEYYKSVKSNEEGFTIKEKFLDGDLSIKYNFNKIEKKILDKKT